MQKTICLLILLNLSFFLSGQTIIVQPYLQNASPNSIHILWETSEGEESIVEWGLTNDLGATTFGTSFVNNGTSLIHDVFLTGLSRFTPYYYRIKTGNVVSDIYRFKTPPFAGEQASFRLVAMSDMQRDGSNPNKFAEIVNQGIIQHQEETFGGELSDNLAMVLIPGDLVANGDSYAQWYAQFFGPAQALLSQVPVYPVLGNHEDNSMYYFNYFNLPENGTSGFEEHWWYKDYSNLRVIGLNSNGPYNSIAQLNWLDSILTDVCTVDSIDFVFAELHHPHKSELWTPGESNFTGEVIARLEQFSSDCDKPSIHFFGHTHGYSRGQSRDHKHLWINVATAGGAIDNWGEFPQFDYDEFSRSFDDWGFVTVDVSSGDAPEFTVKRYSRGNDEFSRDNELRDSFTVRQQNMFVEQPTPLFPVNESVSPNCVILDAGDFVALDVNQNHGQSHWQISTDCDDFSTITVETWKNFENYYYDINTQAEDDLTDERITGLSESTTYCWRVRYRDRELNWSQWSTPASFTTGASSFSANLLTNPGAENDLFQWTSVVGVSEFLTAEECDGISPHSGIQYFGIGGICEESAYAKCIQDVNITSFADSIDTGEWYANFGGYLSNYSGSDLPELKLFFINENGEALDSTLTRSTNNSTWTLVKESSNIPVGTRFIQFALMGTRNSGLDNDSYFDDLFLNIGYASADCSELINANQNFTVETIDLSPAPNPFYASASINLPHNNYNQLNIEIRNNLGQKVNFPIDILSNKIIINRGRNSSGLYTFLLREKGVVIGKGKFVTY